MKSDGAERTGLALTVLPAVCILLATWLLLWLAQGVGTVCALAYSCPEPDVRVAPALLFGGLMPVSVPVAALAITGRLGLSWVGVRILAYILFVGLAFVGMTVVLFSGGFTVPLML